MTLEKHKNFKKKNLTYFAENFWENILSYFQNLSAEFYLDFGQKKANFTRFWKNYHIFF